MHTLFQQENGKDQRRPIPRHYLTSASSPAFPLRLWQRDLAAARGQCLHLGTTPSPQPHLRMSSPAIPPSPTPSSLPSPELFPPVYKPAVMLSNLKKQSTSSSGYTLFFSFAWEKNLREIGICCCNLQSLLSPSLLNSLKALFEPHSSPDFAGGHGWATSWQTLM